MTEDLTIDELCFRLRKPVISLSKLMTLMDNHARNLGFENHKDLLLKTGWCDRFAKRSYINNQT